MENKPITYRQLDKVLSHLGFTRERFEPKWLRYEHPASNTIIVLVEKKPNELVRVTDALSARIHLVENGLISEEEMEAMLAPKAPVKKR